MNDVSVIIVLYNEFELVKTCLASVYKESHEFEVILVDNSSDKSGHKSVLTKFPKVKYIQNKKDVGFGSAVNIGIKHSKREFIVVLTPDMYILPGTIKKSYEFLEKHPDAGLVGCRVYAKPGVQEFSALFSYPGLLSHLYYYNMPFYKILNAIIKKYNPLYFSAKAHKTTQAALAVSGQSMMIRKSAVSEVNFFDSRFFLYFEDIDLCKRLNESGWRVVYIPEGGVVQNGISEWKKSTRITQSFPDYLKSLYKFYIKHYGKSITLILWLVGLTSVIISIPYLFTVLCIKKSFGLKTQTQDLLPLWVKILHWHLTEGLMVFK